MPPSPADPTKRRVLIATASVGAGHNAAARSVVEQIAAAAPELQVDCADVLTFAPWMFRAYYAGGFRLGMTLVPHIYGLGYWMTNRPQRPGLSLTERPRLWMERLALRRFGQYVLDQRPDLIVNTHFLSASYLGGLISRGRLKARQMVIVTDCEIHRFWHAQHVEHWFAPAEFTAARLRQWGIPPDRITWSGMPVHPKWTQPIDRARALADWHLPSDKRIVLLTGGTEFVCGPIARIARRVAEGCPEAFVVVLAGRNKKLLAKIARTGGPAKRFVGVGYTDRIHELVEACSLMITKAGGSTTAECLAKAIPMVLLKPVPGHETGNARYFAREGAGVVTRDVGQVVAEVSRLLADADALARLADGARRLYRPATETIVEKIRAALAQG